MTPSLFQGSVINLNPRSLLQTGLGGYLAETETKVMNIAEEKTLSVDWLHFHSFVQVGVCYFLLVFPVGFSSSS